MWLQNLAQDVQFAIRQLIRRPVFTITAMLILALGLGANTAIFSVVNALLLRPLPYKDPSRLVALFERDPLGPSGGSEPFNTVAPGNFLDWQKQASSFEQIGAAFSDGFSLSSPSQIFEPLRVDGSMCSHNLFATLGVSPMLGREFLPDEDRWGAAHVAIISYNLWQRHFGGATDIIHKQIRLNGDKYEIVGVMPRGFAFVHRTIDIWVPLLAAIPPEEQKTHENHYLLVVGRLKRGVTVVQARAEIDGIAARYKRAHPNEVSGSGGNAVTLQRYLVQDVRTSLLVLLGAVGCVLLIACVNVANLLLTRAAGRMREVAIREAVGASRNRIVRQLLTESVVLSLMGGAIGILLASFATQALVLHAPRADRVLPSGSLSTDPMVFLFAFAAALIAGTAAGMFPALQSARSELVNNLKDSTRSATPSRSQGRFRNVLVASEVALSLVLLISAGLLLRSFSQLYQVKTGVRLDHSLVASISLPDPTNQLQAKKSAFLRQLGAQLQSVPGVVSAGMVSCAPVDGHCSDVIFEIEGRPMPAGKFIDALYRGADPGYFAAAGIPLIRGRVFNQQDGIGFDEKHPRLGAMVISQSMAKEFFPHDDPIGKRIYFVFDVRRAESRGGAIPRYEIIGVVGDVVKHLDAPVEPTMYIPMLDGHFDDVYLMLHTAVEPASVTNAVRETIHRLNPDLPLFQVRTMEEVVGQSASDREFSMLLLSTFAAIAILLAVVGLYGVLSYSVSQRRTEIGIRLALGADASKVRGLVLREGMKPTIAGVAAGLIGALAASRLMESMLFKTAPLDPLTFIVVPVLLILVAILACYLPAWRATLIDPTVALRSE